MEGITVKNNYSVSKFRNGIFREGEVVSNSLKEYFIIFKIEDCKESAIEELTMKKLYKNKIIKRVQIMIHKIAIKYRKWKI